MTASPVETPSPFEGTTAIASPAAAGRPITLVEGQTFCLSSAAGDVCADLPHGLFVLDTRVLSTWELRIDGHVLEPLAADVRDPYSASFVTRARPGEGHADANVVVFRDRNIGRGMRERVSITNHGLTPTRIAVDLTCGVDFADLFEVKESRVPHRHLDRPQIHPSAMRFRGASRGVDKIVDVRTSTAGSPTSSGLMWDVELAPRATWETCLEIALTTGGTVIEPRFTCDGSDDDAVPAQRLATWRANLPTLVTDSPALSAAVGRAAEDLGALRIFDPDHPDVTILAAGAPWFMTVFGRDSLLTAWMALIADRRLAHGVLETLARFQGRERNDATEEEPGKILHEMRFGAAAGLALGGGDVYYGSVDATPLFVMLLGELRRWHRTDEHVRDLLPNADLALAWIDECGDRDGDGYVEYGRLSPRGLANQGWKDSWDAIRHADGELARPPIALCEVQGYVFAAYVGRAEIARDAGDVETFERYRRKARDLYRRFNDDFWLDEHGCYAMALDADKRPVAALGSNIGHCLWTGIIDPGRAEAVAEQLLSPQMFSGWGVRTLATSMPAYNPVSYHNGSVWPHDNAICAAGLARYGKLDAAHRIIDGQLAVADAFDGRLPELFSGFERGRPSTPAAYPTSCSPQAWAAASPLLWLRVMLRLDPSADGRVWIHPELPEWVRTLHVTGIDIGDHELAVEIDASSVRLRCPGLTLLEEPRPPLDELLEH